MNGNYGIRIADARNNAVFRKTYKEERNLSRIELGLSLVRTILEGYKAQI
ncbi:MAG: hypothetical protein ACFE9T_08915 [Promethearchaeota archaeon]